MSRFREIEGKKSDLLDRLSRWTDDQLYFSPAAAQWSAVQVVDHLVRTESEIQKVVLRGLSNPHRIGLSDRARTLFLNTIFKSDRKVSVPKSGSVVLPVTGLSLQAVADRWDTSRKELAQILQDVSESNLRKGVFRHPVGGWMNMNSVLEFFSVHITHHEHQLKRLSDAYSRSALAAR